MTDIAIHTLTSELHDAQAVKSETEAFLLALGLEDATCTTDFAGYGHHALDLIFVRTGGTEGLFRQCLPQLIRQGNGRPIYLLASCQHNSLAASLEILSYLQQQGLRGEVVHGHAEQAKTRLQRLLQVGKARNLLRGMRLGVIGTPSDWLIASQADPAIVLRRWGIQLVDLPITEVEERFAALSPVGENDWEMLSRQTALPPLMGAIPVGIRHHLPGALRIYRALQGMVADHQLDGFTLRCFDLLGTLRNTGCLALSLFNSQGIIASCEGDVPALLSMAIAHALTGQPGFQANPASIDTSDGELLLAHCTIPFCMVSEYALDTHFESGIGVGIRGIMANGPVTLFKASANEPTPATMLPKGS